MILQNVGTDPVYIQVTPEGNALTVDNGFKLYPGSAMDFNDSGVFSSRVAAFSRDGFQQGPIQAIADTGNSVEVRYIIS